MIDRFEQVFDVRASFERPFSERLHSFLGNLVNDLIAPSRRLPSADVARLFQFVKARVDVAGSIVALLVAMTEGRNWGWTSINTLGLLATSLVFFVLLFLVESRVSEPMINLTILSKRNVFVTNVAAFALVLRCT